MKSMGRDLGSIGIGAMIVFIALILVAAIASTIIISSVEDLSDKSEQSNDDRQLSKVEISGILLLMNCVFRYRAPHAQCSLPSTQPPYPPLDHLREGMGDG